MAYNTGDPDIFTENVGCYNLHISGKAKRKELKHYEKEKSDQRSARSVHACGGHSSGLRFR